MHEIIITSSFTHKSYFNPNFCITGLLLAQFHCYSHTNTFSAVSIIFTHFVQFYFILNVLYWTFITWSMQMQGSQEPVLSSKERPKNVRFIRTIKLYPRLISLWNCRWKLLKLFARWCDWLNDKYRKRSKIRIERVMQWDDVYWITVGWGVMNE